MYFYFYRMAEPPVQPIVQKQLKLLQSKRVTRASEILLTYTKVQQEIAQLLEKNIFDPVVSEKLDLKNWYSGNNSLSIFNLKQIVKNLEFEKSIEEFVGTI
jgi:hypothetical protein